MSKHVRRLRARVVTLEERIEMLRVECGGPNKPRPWRELDRAEQMLRRALSDLMIAEVRCC